jgi:hypothetical protein
MKNRTIYRPVAGMFTGIATESPWLEHFNIKMR